jgi:acylphosphatase
MSITHKRLHAIVRGKVQGVSFRYYTLLRAHEIGVTGWVQNLPDRSVEVVAEGEALLLEELLAFLHRGPLAARVTAVEVEWFTATGDFTDFVIH